MDGWLWGDLKDTRKSQASPATAPRPHIHKHKEPGAPLAALPGPTAPTCSLPLWAAELCLNCPTAASSRLQGRPHILPLWRSVSESKVTPLGLCPACALRQENLSFSFHLSKSYHSTGGLCVLVQGNLQDVLSRGKK